jgi:hypothetical protein
MSASYHVLVCDHESKVCAETYCHENDHGSVCMRMSVLSLCTVHDVHDRPDEKPYFRALKFTSLGNYTQVLCV